MDAYDRYAAVVGTAAIVVIMAVVTIVGWPVVTPGNSGATCQLKAEVAELPNYPIPAVLLNSPYGGNGSGTGIVPSTYPGAWEGPPPEGVYAVGFGTGASNGFAESAYFTVNVSVYSVINGPPWSASSDLSCSSGFAIELQPPSIYDLEGGLIMGPNNTSDINEPSSANLPSYPIQAQSLIFNNSFVKADMANVSTCGGPTRSLGPIATAGLNVWFPVSINGSIHILPYRLPFQQTYHYSFPANFGTWAIDNLALGPNGGGYAFSFTPCPT
ncbi:MAG: hypothetical protein WB789_10430 [Thermoplasmata archaeon]